MKEIVTAVGAVIEHYAWHGSHDAYISLTTNMRANQWLFWPNELLLSACALATEGLALPAMAKLKNAFLKRFFSDIFVPNIKLQVLSKALNFYTSTC